MRLSITSSASAPPQVGPLALPVPARPRREIRVVLGPQDHFFPPESIATFLSEPYALTASYDRMGARLKGPRLEVLRPLDMPSEAVVRGAIQVAGDGQPTVLLADHQTTGGYPKIATVASIDLDAFTQLRSHASVRFRAVSVEQAVALLRTRRQVARRGRDEVA
jgi:allophanate hydrolase